MVWFCELNDFLEYSTTIFVFGQFVHLANDLVFDDGVSLGGASVLQQALDDVVAELVFDECVGTEEDFHEDNVLKR